jgi:hypothetical protein
MNQLTSLNDIETISIHTTDWHIINLCDFSEMRPEKREWNY